MLSLLVEKKCKEKCVVDQMENVEWELLHE